MKKNVSLLLFALAAFTIASAFYLARNSAPSNVDKRVDEKVVLVDSVEVK